MQSKGEWQMSTNKLMLKDRVLTRGGGNQRVVLDYDSGLIYQYQNPENVISAYVAGKGWVTKQAPYYRSGSWGRQGQGDKEGHSTVSNANDLLSAIATWRQVQW